LPERRVPRPSREPYRPDVGDRWLPVYSVVVALHKEARVVPQLIAALDAIDYPRGSWISQARD
jgi:hypothetical protein